MRASHHRELEIVRVLSRHGFAYVLDRVGLSHPYGRGQTPSRRAQPEHLRLALEELGPTFIKLGQALSIRADLLPGDYRAELARLQDDAPHLAPRVVWEILTHELGAEAENAFGSFQLEPLAAASIGQAHGATLRDGTEVVVKVRRPGAVDQVEQDMAILRHLAARADQRSKLAAQIDLVGLIDEFAQTLRAELDYINEGRNAERFAAAFAGDPDVLIPRVFWASSTSRIITLERVRGMKITDRAALEAAGIDRRDLARRATRAVARTVFDDGFFHADPHPGNFFIQEGGRIGIIDFGMVGTLDDRLRDQLTRMILALVREDSDLMVASLVELGAAGVRVDRVALREEMADLLARYSRQPLGTVAFGTAIGEIFDVIRRYGLSVPRDLALLVKAFVMDESLAAELDPEFDLVAELTPYATRQLMAELTPAALRRQLERMGIDFAALAVDLPRQVHRTLGVLADGRFEVHLRGDELEPLLARTERLGNRIAGSVLAAAMINAAAALAAGRRRRPRRRLRRPGRP